MFYRAAANPSKPKFFVQTLFYQILFSTIFLLTTLDMSIIHLSVEDVIAAICNELSELG
jgi:hypothetical protein